MAIGGSGVTESAPRKAGLFGDINDVFNLVQNAELYQARIDALETAAAKMDAAKAGADERLKATQVAEAEIAEGRAEVKQAQAEASALMAEAASIKEEFEDRAATMTAIMESIGEPSGDLVAAFQARQAERMKARAEGFKDAAGRLGTATIREHGTKGSPEHLTVS